MKSQKRTVPDLQIRGGGVLKNKFFLALRASVWSKIRGGGRAPRATPMNPPLGRNLTVTVSPFCFSLLLIPPETPDTSSGYKYSPVATVLG